MKKLLAMAVAVGVSMMVATAMAGEKGGKGEKGAAHEKGKAAQQPAQIVQVSGTLAVTKDADGKVTGMKLTDAKDNTVYTIKPTEFTKDLEAKDGQQVDITAALREHKGEKVLMVKPPKGAGKHAAKEAKEAAAAPVAPAAPAVPAVPAVPAAK